MKFAHGTVPNQFGIILSWSDKETHRTALNDSKWIHLSIPFYFFQIMWDVEEYFQ